MDQKPRQFTTTFFSIKELSTSIIQGLMITAGLVWIYWFAVNNGENEPTTTAMVFITLITSNILLTLVNRSFHFSILTTLKYKNILIPVAIAVTIFLVIVIFAIPAFRTFFKFETPQPREMLICVSSGILSVLWFEGYKWFKRPSNKSSKSEV
jgi:Ca2+-transporting ATPase